MRVKKFFFGRVQIKNLFCYFNCLDFEKQKLLWGNLIQPVASTWQMLSWQSFLNAMLQREKESLCAHQRIAFLRKKLVYFRELKLS